MPPTIEMYWVAEYWDGQALPQYDPFSGVEHRYSEVNHKATTRLWLIPVTPDMVKIFPGTGFNPRLVKHMVELKGSKGFVCRRMSVQFKPTYKVEVKCYVLGIEGGARREIYPDGSVIDKLEPDVGETQSLLHG